MLLVARFMWVFLCIAGFMLSSYLYARLLVGARDEVERDIMVNARYVGFEGVGFLGVSSGPCE